MSEVSGDPVITPANGVATPVGGQTGGVGAGLDGLRELIRIKKEILAQNGEPEASRSSADDQPTKKARKRSRGRKNKQPTETVAPESVEFRLPFEAGDIVYGEVVGKPKLTDVRLYVKQDGKVLIYDHNIFPDQDEEYLQHAGKLLNDHRDHFRSITVGDITVYLANNANLLPKNGELIYGDKYKIVCRNDEVLEAIIKVLTPEAPKSDLSADLVRKVLLVQEVAKKVASTGQVQPADVMNVFLAMGEASDRLAQKVLGVSLPTIERVTDHLRARRAIDEPDSDGKYPILIQDIAELEQAETLSSEEQINYFCQAVHSETVRGKKLLYDLAELPSVKMADNYVRAVASFCRASTDVKLRHLFSEADELVQVSEVLQLVSADGSVSSNDLASQELFQNYVTKYMLVAEYPIDSVGGGFPWFQFQISRTDRLKLDTLRYLMANISWISCIYTNTELGRLARIVRALKSSVSESTFAATKDTLTVELTRIIEERKAQRTIDQAQLKLAKRK